MTPLERAGKVREILLAERPYNIWEDAGPELRALMPPGSLILTPDEAEKVRGCLMAIEADDRHPAARMAIALLAGKEEEK